MPHKLAIYDMDRTITRRGTYADFLIFAARRSAPLRLALLPGAGWNGLLYAARQLNRARLKERNLQLLLGRRLEAARMLPIVDAYAARVVRRNIRRDALAQIAADQAAGYRIIFATASFALYARAIAARLGVAPGDVIGTQLAPLVRTAGHAPAISGANCYGADKLAMVEQWLAEAGIRRDEAHIRFYSDHVSDAPCLGWADEAIATSPHPPLRRLAQRQGWQVVDWR